MARSDRGNTVSYNKDSMRAYPAHWCYHYPQRACTMRITVVTFSVCLSELILKRWFCFISPNKHQSTAGDCLKVSMKRFLKSILTRRKKQNSETSTIKLYMVYGTSPCMLYHVCLRRRCSTSYDRTLNQSCHSHCSCSDFFLSFA